jgi:hypothetical protein
MSQRGALRVGIHTTGLGQSNQGRYNFSNSKTCSEPQSSSAFIFSIKSVEPNSNNSTIYRTQTKSRKRASSIACTPPGYTTSRRPPELEGEVDEEGLDVAGLVVVELGAAVSVDLCMYPISFLLDNTSTLYAPHRLRESVHVLWIHSLFNGRQTRIIRTIVLGLPVARRESRVDVVGIYAPNASARPPTYQSLERAYMQLHCQP